MLSFAPVRRRAQSAAAGLALVAGFSVAMAQPQRGRGQEHFAPPPPQQNHSMQARPSQGRPPQQMRPQRQEHLGQWMDRHSNLPLAQQQKALEKEPGFRDLPLQTQQRMRDNLARLNSMPPEQRRRYLDRTEAMERLTIQQRQQVRGALGQLGSLPADRQRVVARAFHDLQAMPPSQRQAMLNSDRFRGQFSDHERNTLTNLLSVEPYLPVQRP
jgi:hypothetical protein